MYNYPNNTPNEYWKPTSLGLYLLPRGLGTLLGVEMIKLLPDLDRMYAADGVLSHELLAPQNDNDPFAAYKITADLALLLTESISPIYLLALLYLLACLCLMVGWMDKLFAFVLLLLHHSFFLANYSWSYGADYLAQIGLYFSLLFGGKKAFETGWQKWTGWGRILLGIQLSAVYLFAGLGKATGSSWWNGEAIWKALQQPFGWVLFAIPESYAAYNYLWVILGWGTVLLEIGYVLAWINPTFRNIIVYSTILMHLGILICMGLTHFALLMIWYNCCVWIFPNAKVAKPIIYILERGSQKVTGSWLRVSFNTRKGGTN